MSLEKSRRITYGALYHEMQPSSCAKPLGRSDALSRCSWTYRPCRTSGEALHVEARGPSHTFPPHSTDHLSLKTAPCLSRQCCYIRSARSNLSITMRQRLRALIYHCPMIHSAQPQPPSRRCAVTYGCKQDVTGRCRECQACAHPDNTGDHTTSRRESLSGSYQHTPEPMTS